MANFLHHNVEAPANQSKLQSHFSTYSNVTFYMCWNKATPSLQWQTTNCFINELYYLFNITIMKYWSQTPPGVHEVPLHFVNRTVDATCKRSKATVKEEEIINLVNKLKWIDKWMNSPNKTNHVIMITPVKTQRQNDLNIWVFSLIQPFNLQSNPHTRHYS